MIHTMLLCFMDSMTLLASSEIPPYWRFFGRLHPLVLHFPIAMLMAAAAVELVLCWRRDARPNVVASFCLWVGMAFAVLAAWTGWEMAANEGIEGNPVKAALLGWHRWTGVVLAGLTVALCVSWLIERMSRTRWSFHVYRYGLWAAGVLVCFVGHFGAEMKWGQDYLFSVLRSSEAAPASTPAPEEEKPDKADASEAVVVGVSWSDEIEPIFQEQCSDCHGPEKQKGKLQLVPWEAFESHRSLIDVANPVASILVHRISLPSSDPDAMPPEGPKLSDEQIDLIMKWIGEGAIGAATADSSSGGDQEGASAPASRTDPATRRPSPFDAAKQLMAVNAIRELGGHAVPISEDSPWIDVNLSLVRPPVTDEQIAILGELKKTLIWLNLGATSITDKGLQQTVSKLTALHRLRLDRTSIGNPGVASLGSLQALEVLNLFGTKVTDDCLPMLESMSSLKAVYLWDTGVTPSGIQGLRDARPDMEVVGGPTSLPPPVGAEPAGAGDEAAAGG